MNPGQTPQCAATWHPAQLSIQFGAQGRDLRSLHAASSQEGALSRVATSGIQTVKQSAGVLGRLMLELSQLSLHENRWICWFAPPRLPDVRVLSDRGIDLSRVLRIYPKMHQEGLQLIERTLSSGKCSAVLAWPVINNNTCLERLRVAAETGNTRGFLFRF